jgi:hypothetical protein
MSKINKTPIETRLAIERRSAAMLPDRPTQAGFKPWEIRNALFSAIIADKGACLMGEIDRIVDETNAAIDAMRIKSGTLTVPMSHWKGEETPRAECAVGPIYTAGCAVLFIPEDDETKEQARLARISMAVNETVDGEWSDVVVFVGAGGTIPSVDLHFRYVVMPTESEAEAIVALVGVDTYGEGGGVGGLTQAETEMIVKKIVPEWARSTTPPDAQDVRADPVGTAESMTSDLRDEVNSQLATYDKSTAVNNKISTHNTSTIAHEDIRLLIRELRNEINKFLNVDDATRDELSEVLGLIDANAGSLESLTSSKVNVTDIIDNLTTKVTNKPLSAAQGVAIKDMIDALEAEFGDTMAEIEALLSGI